MFKVIKEFPIEETAKIKSLLHLADLFCISYAIEEKNYYEPKKYATIKHTKITFQSLNKYNFRVFIFKVEQYLHLQKHLEFLM